MASVVGDEGNSSVAAIYETSLRLVKRQQDADLNVFVTKDASEGVSIVKDIRDASSYYPFRTSACIEKVNARLKGRGVKILFGGEEIPRFNKFHFNLFVKGHNVKGDSRFSYNRNSADENPYYVYSQRTIEFIVERLSKEPDTYLDKLKHHSTSAK